MEQNLLPLCVNEGLYIEKQWTGFSINDRNEARRGGIIRLTALRLTWGIMTFLLGTETHNSW